MQLTPSFFESYERCQVCMFLDVFFSPYISLHILQCQPGCFCLTFLGSLQKSQHPQALSVQKKTPGSSGFLGNFHGNTCGSHEKRAPGWARVIFRGWNFLPSYIGILINHEIRIPINQPVFHGKYGRVFWVVAHLLFNRGFNSPSWRKKETMCFLTLISRLLTIHCRFHCNE